MNRARSLKIATVLLLASFLLEMATIIGMVFLRDLLVKLGIFKIFFEVHEYNGSVFVALVLVHLFFNWGWIRANILKIK